MNDTSVICSYSEARATSRRVETNTRVEVNAEQQHDMQSEPVSVELSERDREILAFERQWWKYAGAKEQAIKELFDMSATRYYQVLNALIDTPEAVAADPMLVKRLRRLRASRQRARSARRLGINV
jgi:hypothetical protein